jgi:type IV fimbrial biogenesis protein FimT
VVNIDRRRVVGVFRLRYPPAGNSAWHNPQQGFTLVELMIGVLLVSVLLGIGLPLFRSFILEQRLRATTADLRIALTLARSEAVKRNRVMELKKNAAGWSRGWSIPSPIAGDPDILTHVQAGDVAISGPDEATLTPAGRALLAAEFEIDMGPEMKPEPKRWACLELRSDGHVDSCRRRCPIPNPMPQPCP